MMKRLLLASTLLVLPVAAHAGMLRGAGATSCGTWLADRADFGMNNLMLNWALGYLSATADLSATGLFDPLATADANAVMYWLDNFCSAHPVLSFADALKSFALERLTGQPNDWQAAR
jgi:hypothetical protein